MLYIFSGLPGTGKTALARELARRRRAVHLRIDTIEQALRDSGAALHGEEGYRVAYQVAADNLRLGVEVVADSVNPISLTREAWREVARRCGSRCVEIEVICSDVEEHRRRVETRRTDVPGLRLPTWEAVMERAYEAWDGPRLVLDTSGQAIEQTLAGLLRTLELPGVDDRHTGAGCDDRTGTLQERPCR